MEGSILFAYHHPVVDSYDNHIFNLEDACLEIPIRSKAIQQAFGSASFDFVTVFFDQ